MGILCHKVVPESSKQKGRLFTTAFGFAVNDDDENNDDKNYHGTTSMVAPLGGGEDLGQLWCNLLHNVFSGERKSERMKVMWW